MEEDIMKKSLLCIIILLTAYTAQDSFNNTPDAQVALEVVEAPTKHSKLENDRLEQQEHEVESIGETSLGLWCKSGIYLEIIEIGKGEYVKRIRTGNRTSDEPLRRSSDGQFHLNNSAKTFYAIRPNALEVRTRHGFEGVLLHPSKESTDVSCVPVKR
jgi:hypothetical protein